MAKLFIGLAIAVVLGAAVLSFLTKAQADKLQSNLKETKQTLARTETTLRRAESESKKAQEELVVANAKVEQQATEMTGLKADKEKAVMELAEAKMALDARTKELADIQEKMKGGDATKPAVDPTVVVAELEAKKAELAKAQAELAEKSQMVETLNRSKVENDEKLANANKEIERYRAGVTKSGLSGKILAVNPGWNFVVLSVGDRQGAATGGVMIVTRSGEPIGRVRITSIEPSTSIADIIPGSVRRGVTVQPGDTVVYEGPRSKPSALGVPAPGVPAVPPVGNN
ncbi:MAG: hypothetical protein WCF18_04985 [Chthoniobacteraceae bacterium]